MLGFEEVEKYDPELAQAMSDELTRQRTHIELIASENLVSKAVMAAMGSVLTNKYAEGYPCLLYTSTQLRHVHSRQDQDQASHLQEEYAASIWVIQE